MFCAKCGTQLTDDSRFCYNCGTPTNIDEQNDHVAASEYDHFDSSVPPKTEAPAPKAQPQSDAPAKIDDGIFSILGFILSFFVPIAGLVLSIIGMIKKKHPTLATAGMILGIVFTILYAIIIVVAVENNTPAHPNYYYIY